MLITSGTTSKPLSQLLTEQSFLDTIPITDGYKEVVLSAASGTVRIERGQDATTGSFTLPSGREITVKLNGTTQLYVIGTGTFYLI